MLFFFCLICCLVAHTPRHLPGFSFSFVPGLLIIWWWVSQSVGQSWSTRKWIHLIIPFNLLYFTIPFPSVSLNICHQNPNCQLRSCSAEANNSHSIASSGSIQFEKFLFVMHAITHLNGMSFASTKSKAINTTHFIQRTLNWWNSSAVSSCRWCKKNKTTAGMPFHSCVNTVYRTQPMGIRSNMGFPSTRPTLLQADRRLTKVI